MKNYRNILLALAFTCTASMVAQKESLTKEIVVEKDFVPTEQKATKLNNLPDVSKVTVQSKTLNYSDWAIPTIVNPTIPTLFPLGYATTHKFSDKRGYLDFGMGSFLNMTGSAGYKILDTEKNTLNVWLQHNSTWTGKNTTSQLGILNENSGSTLTPLNQKVNDNILGVDFSHKIGNNTLNVNAFYHLDHFNYYSGMPADYDHNGILDTMDENFQTVNEFNINLSYRNSPINEDVRYLVAIAYNHFGNKDGIKENNFKLNGDISMQSSEKSRIGVDLAVDYLHYTDLFGMSPDKSNIGKVSLTPYYHLQNERMDLKIGVNLDLSINDGTILRFSPDVKFDYKLAKGFLFFADFTGGKRLNTFSDIATINRYFNTYNNIGSSYSPLDIIGGFKLGSFAGFTAKLWGGYAIINNQQLPYSFYDKPNGIITYRGLNMSGWQVGAELGYKYKNIAELTTKFAYSPQNENKGYVFSDDRPEYIVGAQLKVTPIEKLTITANYELRANRSMWSRYELGTVPAVEHFIKTDLGNMNLLNIGASYRINDMFGVFAQFNNILNKQWDSYYFMGAQKFNAFAGVSVLF